MVSTGWVSIDEILPSKSSRVLVALRGHKDPAVGMFTVNGWSVLGMSCTAGRLVTHWMPLPKPPWHNTH